jgi:hypothetical protein
MADRSPCRRATQPQRDHRIRLGQSAPGDDRGSRAAPMAWRRRTASRRSGQAQAEAVASVRQNTPTSVQPSRAPQPPASPRLASRQSSSVTSPLTPRLRSRVTSLLRVPPTLPTPDRLLSTLRFLIRAPASFLPDSPSSLPPPRLRPSSYPPGLACHVFPAGRGRGVQREAVDPPSSKAQALSEIPAGGGAAACAPPKTNTKKRTPRGEHHALSGHAHFGWAASAQCR